MHLFICLFTRLLFYNESLYHPDCHIADISQNIIYCHAKQIHYHNCACDIYQHVSCVSGNLIRYIKLLPEVYEEQRTGVKQIDSKSTFGQTVYYPVVFHLNIGKCQEQKGNANKIKRNSRGKR